MRTPPNQYLYNGKELNEELGLGWYDYGFRWYDPVIARFPSVDPLANKFKYQTPYQYANNNPVVNIDIDGLEGGNTQTGEVEEDEVQVQESKNVPQYTPPPPVRTPQVGTPTPVPVPIWLQTLRFAGRVLGTAGLVIMPVPPGENGIRPNNGFPVAETESSMEPTPLAPIPDQDEKNDETIVYRGMQNSPEGGPQTGPTARTLGARPGTDISVDATGMVYPGTGGMSVAPNTPTNLPIHRRPPTFGGTGKDPVWGINVRSLPPTLNYVPDSPSHGTIQPARAMPLNAYQKALHSTSSGWIKTPPPNPN